MQWAQPDSRRLESWRPCVSHLVKQQKINGEKQELVK